MLALCPAGLGSVEFRFAMNRVNLQMKGAVLLDVNAGFEW